MMVVTDWIVVSTLRPGTICSRKRMPTGSNKTRKAQKTLYQLAGSSSFFKFFEVNVATTVDAAVAPQASVIKTTAM